MLQFHLSAKSILQTQPFVCSNSIREGQRNSRSSLFSQLGLSSKSKI